MRKSCGVQPRTASECPATSLVWEIGGSSVVDSVRDSGSTIVA